MNKDFEKCLKNKRIVPQDHAHDLIVSELETAKEDLAETKMSLKQGRYKWATIQAYYSIFHAARALLFAKGYRGKSHVCLKYAIKALYVDEEVLDQKYVEQFDVTMLLRKTTDYKRDFSKEGAELASKNAEEFLAETERILILGTFNLLKQVVSIV